MPFKPGQSGNPGGRAAKSDIVTRQIIAALNSIDPKTQFSRARTLGEKLVNLACEGDMAAANAVMDRAEGKVSQPIAGDEESPLTLILGGLGAAVDAKLDRLIAARIAAPKVEPE